MVRFIKSRFILIILLGYVQFFIKEIPNWLSYLNLEHVLIILLKIMELCWLRHQLIQIFIAISIYLLQKIIHLQCLPIARYLYLISIIKVWYKSLRLIVLLNWMLFCWNNISLVTLSSIAANCGVAGITHLLLLLSKDLTHARVI